VGVRHDIGHRRRDTKVAGAAPLRTTARSYHHGDRDDNVLAVGTKGLILHWDGTTWSQEESGLVQALRSIHGAGGTAWIVGDLGTVLVRALRAGSK
jgi:hypothetical protein